MNICYVIEYFYPFNIGGAEISAFEHAKELIKAGYKIIVITPNYGTKKYEVIDGVEVYRFQFKKLKFGKEVNSLYFMNPLYYFYLAWQVYKVAKKYNCGIIHAQNTYSIIGSFIAAKLLRKKFFVTLRDYSSICSLGAFCLLEKDYPPARCGLIQNLRCLPRYQKLYHPNISYLKKLKASVRLFIQFVDLKLRREILKKTTKIITVSNAVKEIYSVTGISKGLMETVYNLPPKIEKIDKEEVERLRSKLNLNNKKVVLYVGKMSYGKGTDILIKAIPEVIKVIPNVCFVFAGRTNPLIKISDELDNCVKVLGHIPNKDVQTLYEICDLVVIPSRWPEPYPRVALESSFHNKPIVATRTGGTSEALSVYEKKILIKPGNVDELVFSIVMLLRRTTHFNYKLNLQKEILIKLIKVYSL